MDKRPTYHVKITGDDWDKDGMPLAIETEDQCRGVMAFMFDDDHVCSRMYGESNVADLASIIYMLKTELGREVYDVAAHAADMLMESEDNVGSDISEKDPGRDELRGVPESGEGLLEGLRGHGNPEDNGRGGAEGESGADAAVL